MVPVPSANAVRLSYFLHLTPRHVLGRANSVADLLTSGTVPLAPLLVGFGLTELGVLATGLGLAGFSLLGLVLVLTSGELRRLPLPSQCPEPDAAG